MAVWELKQQVKSGNRISQVSWTDGTALDPYYWLEHSFQYSANINCDDELHGIKLSNKADFVSHFSKCQLVSCWDNGVMALEVDNDDGAILRPQKFDEETFYTWGTQIWNQTNPDTDWEVCPWVVFQDFFWYGSTYTDGNDVTNALYAQNVAADGSSFLSVPYDHTDYTDESISDYTTATVPMKWAITAMLNYNNTRLVVACWTELRVYYPELDNYNPNTNPDWWSSVPLLQRKTWWKKVLDYEAGVTIVWLTCTFEYLKVWTVDEGWSSKVYFYQWNNNLRSTFVYNLVDLTGERVLRVYSLNGTDYFTTSIDGTDGYINLNKLVWATPVQLFHQRAWLDPLDINTKAPYFVWPTGINAAYKSGKFYIADAYGVFQFTQSQTSYDKGYMKWLLTDESNPLSRNWRQVYWVCENKGFLYVSDEDGCWKMRLYDTWVDGYQEKGVLISREFEGKEWGTVTKMLDEVRMNFELNPWTNYNGSIDIYVSPNNLRKTTDSFNTSDNWHHVMHIDQTNINTRTEKSNLFNNMGKNSGSSFKFDWQTITYAIVITRYKKNNPNTAQERAYHATPIVRQLDLKYHCKDKTNNVYDITND